MQILYLNLYLCRIQEALGPLVESWNFWVVLHIKTKSVSTILAEWFTFWSYPLEPHTESLISCFSKDEDMRSHSGPLDSSPS